MSNIYFIFFINFIHLLSRCLKNKIKQKTLLVSGKPGCGKTLTVSKTLENFSKNYKKLLYIQLNAMAYKTSQDLFEELKNKIDDSKKNINKNLSEVLQNQNKYDFIILMIDEFDSLFQNQEQILDLLKYANEPQYKLILVGVSNSMELVYKLSKKFKLNLEKVKNLVFKSYDFKQMIEIIQSRVNDFLQKNKLDVQFTLKHILQENALRLCATRIFNLKGGDIRCILDVLLKAFSKKHEKIKLLDNLENYSISLDDLLSVIFIFFNFY